MTSKLYAETLPVVEISKICRDRMHELMDKYYDSTPRDVFESDLNAKDAVILLKDDATSTIQGFSTIVKKELNVQGEKSLGFFSGDTVLEKEYWGSRVLGVAFLKFLWLQKIKNPRKAVYWFLISKGYKTYLLMANNFDEHYPRFDKSTPNKEKALMDNFYLTLYPGKYDSVKGLISSSECLGKLKEGIADIDENLVSTNLRISHFLKLNPNWKDGDELACIATMSLIMPLKYQTKIWLDKILRKK